MEKDVIIQKSVGKLQRMSLERLKAVSDYIDFLDSKYCDDQTLNEGIQKLSEESGAFEFLNEEEDLYSEKDLKEVYK